jgi:phosphohistidine swiveling domain-containing protein
MFTAPFTKIDKNDVDQAGGKGASLGEMTRAGIPVPPGFVILASTFEHFIREAGLEADIDSALHKVKHKDINSIELASEKIQALIKRAKMPKDIALEIKSNFKKLKVPYVAVRSSATAEDSSAAAWAGQLDSYLNTTHKSLLFNVQRCWASLFTPRAIFYRFEKGLHGHHISVAVVVQAMVQSEISGIAFSVHPVTQDYNQMIIEAGFGLGEAIVSGQITPDSYVLEKKPLSIIDKSINVQESGIYRGKKDNEWKQIHPKKGVSQTLSNKQITEIGKLILRIENHYGFPVDVEWAYQRKKFFIVQSRPITTLAARTQPVKKKSASEKKKKLNNWYELSTREGVDIFTIAEIVPIFGDLVKSAGKKSGDLFFSTLISNEFTNYIGEDPRIVGRYAYKKYFNELQQVTSHYQRGQELLRQTNRKTRLWTKRLAKNSNTKNMLAAFQDFHTGFDEICRIYSIQSFIGIEAWQSDFDEVLNRLIAKNKLAQKKQIIAASVYRPWKKTSLSKIREELARGQSVKSLVRKYQFLRSWSAIWNTPITEAWFQSLSGSSQAKDIRLYSQGQLVKLLKPNSSEKRFLEIAPYIVFFKDYRDDTRRQFVFSWSFLFDLISKKSNLSREDLGYLTLREIKEALETGRVDKAVIKKRKSGCLIAVADDLKVEVFDSLPTKYGSIIKQIKLQKKENIVRGKIAYGGVIRGHVKIILNRQDIHKVVAGDILVANTTHPDYLPAMHKAAAFVTNEGGMISHTAIMARELKRPCLVGCGNATKILKERMLVEVDADRGIVKIIK